MPFQYSVGHSFATRSIRAHAPAASGVYGISNGREWLLIGAADNIQAALLEHTAKQHSVLSGYEPTGFNFEVCGRGEFESRQRRLIQEYHPVCNS